MSDDETLVWQCMKCGDVFETEPTHHDPSTCECGEAFVDHESYHLRTNMSVEAVDPDE